MDIKMYGSIEKWMDGWMDEQKRNGYKNGILDGQNKWMVGWIKIYLENRWMVEWIYIF